MTSLAGFVIAAAVVVGQAEKAATDEPEFNPNLKPIAWLIGEWEAEQTTGTGELRNVKRDTYKWTANKNAILLEVTNTNPDGTPGMCGTVIYYWDPAEKTLKYHGVFSNNVVEEGVLIRADGTDSLWRDKIVLPSGNQGHNKFSQSYDQETETLSIGWSKISGSGSNDVGPWKFKRVK